MRYLTLAALLTGCQVSCEINSGPGHNCNLDAGICNKKQPDMQRKTSDEDVILGLWLFNTITNQ